MSNNLQILIEFILPCRYNSIFLVFRRRGLWGKESSNIHEIYSIFAKLSDGAMDVREMLNYYVNMKRIANLKNAVKLLTYIYRY